jgi:hypothetical protein
MSGCLVRQGMNPLERWRGHEHRWRKGEEQEPKLSCWEYLAIEKNEICSPLDDHAALYKSRSRSTLLVHNSSTRSWHGCRGIQYADIGRSPISVNTEWGEKKESRQRSEKWHSIYTGYNIKAEADATTRMFCQVKNLLRSLGKCSTTVLQRRRVLRVLPFLVYFALLLLVIYG